MEDTDTLFTIGHSNHPLEAFLELLQKHNISAVADVRSSPSSRYCPQFNKDPFSLSLKNHGINYVFLGQELGARSSDPSCYVDGQVQYAQLAQKAEFRAAITRLKQGVKKHRIAVMCAEKEPLDCHRTLLVARALDREGLNISHIHSDGQLEKHQDTMDRLLNLSGQRDLFKSKSDLLAQALIQQEKRIAYKQQALEGEEKIKERP